MRPRVTSDNMFVYVCECVWVWFYVLKDELSALPME